MRRVLIIIGAAALLAGAGEALPANGRQVAPAPARSLAPGADAYVTSAAKRRNFGRARLLRIGNRPAARSYLQFDLSKLDAPLTRATLSVYMRTASRGFLVRAAGTGWSERGIRFSNAPSLGLVLGRSPRARARRRVSIALDLNRIPKATGILSLALTGRAATLASRESGARGPRLSVVATPPTLLAAGDIGDCDPTSHDEATAAFVKTVPGTIAALGDLAYENGSLAEFNACYEPSWGPFKSRTKPAPGNHEYLTTGAAGYFAYWGAAAGVAGQGWYSYDVGGWHIVSLNSNCDYVGCSVGSPQESWLRADLAAHQSRCTLAYWHHPRWSGGQVTSDAMTQPLWQALYDANADLVLTGHSHTYQRFAPQNAAGLVDLARGIREFVVGTGGHHVLHPVLPAANVEVLNNTTWGVLRLTLRNSGYDWKFVPLGGSTFTDAGSQACH